MIRLLYSDFILCPRQAAFSSFLESYFLSDKGKTLVSIQILTYCIRENSLSPLPYGRYSMFHIDRHEPSK